MKVVNSILRLIEKRHRLILLVLIPIISFSMHYRIFGLDIIGPHCWRQTFTQTNIVNFYEEDNNILNPRLNQRYHWEGISRMEFPLMQWLYAQFYRIFGNHIIISRILSFIIGLLSVWGIYFLLFQLFRNKSSAVLTAWAFNFSPIFYYYTLNPMPDNFALCFSVWSAAYFIKYIRDQKIKNLLLGSVFLCIASLSKLPFILYYGIIAVYFLSILIKKRFTKLKKEIHHIKIILIVLIPAILWYAWVIPEWQNGITTGIFGAEGVQIAQIWEYISYSFYSTFPELLLNYLAVPFFIWAIWLLINHKLYKKPLFLILGSWGLLILFYFFFEINMITKVHDYYLLPFLPLIFIIVGYAIKNLIGSKQTIKIAFSLFLLILLPLTAYLRIDSRWNTDKPGFNKDLLIYKDELKMAVPDSSLVVVGNDNSPCIWLYYINKKGWVYNSDRLTPEQLYEIRKYGGKYLYSDSRVIDTSVLISNQFERFVLERGSIKIFELKEWPD